MNCHPDRSEAQWRDLRFARRASNSPEAPFVHQEQLDLPATSFTGMNNVSELVITTITPNGSATLPFVIPSEAEDPLRLPVSNANGETVLFIGSS